MSSTTGNNDVSLANSSMSALSLEVNHWYILGTKVDLKPILLVHPPLHYCPLRTPLCRLSVKKNSRRLRRDHLFHYIWAYEEVLYALLHVMFLISLGKHHELLKMDLHQ